MWLPVRQYRCFPLDHAEYDESSFGHVHRELEVDPDHTAFITVDLWNAGWEEEPLHHVAGDHGNPHGGCGRLRRCL